MVVVPLKASIDVGGGRAVYQDVVGGLDGEGLFDLGVWGEDEVDEDGQGDEVFWDWLAFFPASDTVGRGLPRCFILDVWMRYAILVRVNNAGGCDAVISRLPFRPKVLC